MQPEGTLQCSQAPDTSPYSEPEQQSMENQLIPLRSISILPFHLHLDLPSVLFPS